MLGKYKNNESLQKHINICTSDFDDDQEVLIENPNTDSQFYQFVKEFVPLLVRELDPNVDGG